MQITILITVCLTLSVVAVVSLFVAMFVGLRNRVTTQNHRSDLDHLYKRIEDLEKVLDEKIHAVDDDVHERFRDILNRLDSDYAGLDGSIKALRKNFDSRLDKMDHKLKIGSELEQV